MNFQSKLFETAGDFRIRAVALAHAAVDVARSRASRVAKNAAPLKASLATLQVAGRELNKVARRHGVRFVKQNAAIVREAGRDVSALAKAAYSGLSQRETVASRKPRTATRKRAARKAA